MTGSIFAGCTEACGYIAALFAIFGFGSFGVPIKYAATKIIEIDPLVMQSYKTLVCFLTCWLVVFLGEEIRWTNWGIVSGCFFVPSATCGIFAIRNAGLAISTGIWAGCLVIMSFVWGILIFQEPVKHVGRTAMAFSVLGMGLVGMSRYSQPQKSAPTSSTTGTATISSSGSSSSGSGPQQPLLQQPSSMQSSIPPLQQQLLKSRTLDDSDDEDDEEGQQGTPMTTKTKRKNIPSYRGSLTTSGSNTTVNTSSSSSSNTNDMIINTTESKFDDDNIEKREKSKKLDRFVFCSGRFSLTRRQLGLVGAVINGTWGGFNLIPLHFAKREGFGGAAYLISYACGSMIVNTAMWVVYFLFFLQRKRGKVHEALEALPEWHLDKLWIPGFLAGGLYSLGNFGSIMAVTYLGQGVGYSLCQVSILVSGLWGILFFKEIRGHTVVMKWLLSACITVAGILWVTREHGGSAGH